MRVIQFKARSQDDRADFDLLGARGLVVVDCACAARGARAEPAATIPAAPAAVNRLRRDSPEPGSALRPSTVMGVRSFLSMSFLPA